MPVLTIREIYETARAAGFGEREAVTWTAIAMAESGGRTGGPNARGESGGGLWRINAVSGADAQRWGDLDDPRNNARAAFEISRHGTDMGPWTTTHDTAKGTQTDYRMQLGKVEQEIGVAGDDRGISGNGSTLPPASQGAPGGSYDQIDRGSQLGSGATPWTQPGSLPTIGGTAGDSDHDGLSDVFERLVGTDAARVDSDGDGLTDGYEASTGTDPLSTDTDRDGFTDGLEVGQRGDPLTADAAGAVPRWTIESGSQRRLAALSTTPQPAQPGALAQQPGPTTQVPAPAPSRDLNGGRVSADGAEPKLVASLDAAGHGNWQGAVKAGDHWYIGQATTGDKSQIFHRLDSSGKALDQMTVVGAAHVTSFAVIGNTVYATYDGEVVTFPYQPGATIGGEDTTPTGWKGYISIDPTNRLAVIRKGNHYRAYDLETREPVGKEVITPTGQRQGFSIVGDALYVLTGKTNSPGRVDSFSFTTGEHTGTQDVTGVGPGRHREPEGMFGDLMGVKTGLGSARRLNIYQLDTGIAPATEAPPVTDQPPPADPAPAVAADDGGSAADLGPVAESDHGGGGEHADDAGDDGDHVTFGGKTVDRRTASMLAEAERLANEEDPSIGRFNLTQGSFSHSVGASAGTHDGPGAFDMYTRSYSATQKETIGLALRQVGFASWLRRKSQGPWDEHWHGIAIGTKGLPTVAESQVQNYLDGLNGLRGNGKDTDRRPDEIRTWEEYQEQQGSVDHNPATPEATQPTMDPSGNRFDIAGGQQLDPGLDSDADGLTDVFERLAQTDSGRADTDGDGLLDGYEVATSRSDPLLIDSDLDGFTDAAELRFGGNPLGSTTSGTPALGSDPLGSDPLGTDPVGAGEPQHSSGGLLDP